MRSVDCYGSRDVLRGLTFIAEAGLGPIKYLWISMEFISDDESHKVRGMFAGQEQGS